MPVAIALFALMTLATPAQAAATRVQLFADVPPELASYTGNQPLTLGIPFSRGVLKPADGKRLVTAANVAQLGQFQVTSSWDTGGIRWLLVDFVAKIKNGRMQPLFLEYGPGVPNGPAATSLKVTQTGTNVTVRTGALSAKLGVTQNTLGSFLLEGVIPPNALLPYPAVVDSVQVELNGPVRAVVKLSGRYTTGGKDIASFLTRYRFYNGLAFARVYHTFVWLDDATTQIGSIRFTPAGVPSSGATIQTAIDGLPVSATGSYDLQQVDYNLAQDAAALPLGQAWDGWAEVRSASQSLFTAVRWPWQQHPIGFDVSGSVLRLGLVDPISPMSLFANDVVIPPLHNFSTGYTDLATGKGPYVPLSPRGVGKTHEILLWPSRQGTADFTLASSVKNTLLQRPIAGFADPVFVAQADLPSPMSAYNPVEFPEIEGAIERSFDWYTRERADEFDYGIWNFGDIQYDWVPNVGLGLPYVANGHYRPDRYWLNNGKGFSLTPWLLWMRSGNRKYLERGESYARHVMDVDTCHVTNVPELKFVGGTYAYSMLHFGEQSWLLDISNDSEYLPYYYFLTGYERAKDIMTERVSAVVATYPNNIFVPDIQDMIDYLATDYVYPSGNVALNTLKFNREHYRALGELALLYENTLDPALKTRAGQLLASLYASQASNGWLPGIKSNFWFSQSLNIAQRAFPDQQFAIRELLRRWQDHYGTYLQPGTTGIVDGPLSAWDLLTIEAHTGDPVDLQAASEIVRSQSTGFYNDPNEWLGLGTPEANELGPIVRDWVSVMGRLSELPVSQRPTGYAPAVYFNGGLTTDLSKQWYGRHVFFVEDATDAPITLQLDYNPNNGGYHVGNRVRIISPGGVETVIDQVLEPPPTELLTLEPYGVPSPFTPDSISTYHKGSTITISPDGETGAYAVEFYTTNLEAPVFARSSAGKLVHYFPEYIDRAQKLAPGTPVSSYNFPLGHPHPSIHASLSDGTAACETGIAGTTVDGFGNPIGTACSYTPVDTALQSFVTTNVTWHYKMFLEGIEPFVSATPAEWFDPLAVPHPPLDQLLMPRD